MKMFFLWRKVKVLTYKFKGYFHKVWILILYENYKMNKFILLCFLFYVAILRKRVYSIFQLKVNKNFIFNQVYVAYLLSK